ncbi:MAG TPA: Gfo/Idh/MocA family oxidoreductase, partial [Thermoguttaceae bacterium]|nr:Gfo/Idh/MocA family oxidoreductase [Thermoguttaceae bacterium]
MSAAVNRRQFVKTAACATAVVAPALRASGQQPASNRVRIGLIGCGGRGRQLLDVLREFPDVEVPVISDVIEPRMEQAAKILEERPGAKRPERVVHHEQILQRADIDAVVIATTQHWHGLPFIQAAQAGKHVYVEKPLSHTVVEGRAMVDAAKKARIIAMMGSQQRNYPHYVKALEILHSGRLGTIALVECWNYHNTGNRVGKSPDEPTPAGYHWDRWLGPAPAVPFNRSRLNNSWWFDYSGGMLTNWAVHHIDIILAAMRADSPRKVCCPGGQFVVDDLADTPDTVEASWEFPGFVMQYRYRGFNSFHVIQSRPQGHGICFHGNKATMVLDRSGYEIWEDANASKSVERLDNERFWGDGKPGNEVDGPWQRVFVDCVKQGKSPPIDFEESHRATVCCHLANVAYRAGRQIRWDGLAERIHDDR